MNIQHLINVSDDERGPQWEDSFLHALCHENLQLISEEPQNGPDGWPYLFVRTCSAISTEASAETSMEAQQILPVTEPAQKVIQWLSERGIGLVINPDKEYPDFVLTYGMLWSFRETGKFVHRNQSTQSIEVAGQASSQVAGQVELSGASIRTAGSPNETFLPQYARKILREFFRDQGVLSAKILLVSLDNQNFELAFSAESLGNPPESEWEGIAEAISWFLPAHYSILIISEKVMDGFSIL